MIVSIVPIRPVLIPVLSKMDLPSGRSLSFRSCNPYGLQCFADNQNAADIKAKAFLVF